MSKLVVAASLVTVLLIAACSAAPSVPSSGSPVPIQPSPAVSNPPVGSPDPSPSAPAQPASPAPATPEPTAKPTPAPVVWTVEETYLRAGIQRGAIDCVPVRSGLPKGATGGIECRSDDARVAKIGFYIFDGDGEMIDAYYARMKAEGVTLNSGSCAEGEGEGAYIPGEGEIRSRVACFVNAEGYANYRITMPGYLIYIGILGRTANPVDLETFAWLGSQDVPGSPTLWQEPVGG